MSSHLIDESSEFGARVARHLTEDIAIWMTTVNSQGAPVPSPVWFLWDRGETLRMYSRQSPRIRNIARNPQVSLNFPGTSSGGDIVIFSGEATIERDAPRADAGPEYLTKYATEIEGLGMTPQTFADTYNVPVLVRLSGLRGH